MKVSDFDYILPEELIAQTPLADRKSSRLLVLNKLNGKISHHHFYDIIDYLTDQDCLVLNDTKVIPSRLYGTKEETNASIEVLLLNETTPDVWKVLTRPAKRVKVGSVISFGNGILKAVCLVEAEDGIRYLKMEYQGIFLEILEQIGSMPLPPYIHKRLTDQLRYQTVYATHYGSAAAPTAGFHFTKELLEALVAKGVQIEYVTLHVGLGTFRPVSVEDVEKHFMHEETYQITAETASRLNQAKRDGKKIISVGTTSTRTLESNYCKYGCFHPERSATNIFIYPPYQFKAIDGLITNFHLPKSTLLMLVSALSDLSYIKKAYQEAIELKYRFFSFGDAMFITDKDIK